MTGKIHTSSRWSVIAWAAVALCACIGNDAPHDGDRGPLGKADNFGSCASAEGNVCGGKSSGSCWCDDSCDQLGDCCEDKAAVCAGPDQGWATGITGTQSVQITDIDLDPDSGQLAVTGGFYGSATFGAKTEVSDGLRDAFVTRLETAKSLGAYTGKFAWSTRIGTPGGHDIGMKVATHGDATYWIGRIDQNADWDGVPYVRGDLFLAKLDSSGKLEWKTHLGRLTPTASATYGDCDLAVITDGAIVVACDFSGAVDVGDHQPLGVARGLFVAHYAASGAFQRVQVIRSNGTLATADGVHLAAAADGSVTLAANIRYAPYLVGDLVVPVHGGSDVLLARMNAAGTFVWAHAYGGAHDELVHDLALDQYGNLLVTGSWIGKLRYGETCFNHTDFTTNLGGPDFKTPYCGRRAFVASYDAATGAHRHSATIGGRNDKHYLGVSIARLTGGDIALLLSFNGALAVGDATFENSAGPGNEAFDLALLHLNEAGAIITGTHLPGFFAQVNPVAQRRMVSTASNTLYLGGTHTFELVTPSGSVTSNVGAGSGGFVVRMTAP